jgi:hypothetical protein
LVLACLLASCGRGSEAAQLRRPTATPPAAEPTPEGIDVKAVARARIAFGEACKKRVAEGGPLTDARRAAAEMLEALKANPDTPFRYSENLPPATMRQRIRALAVGARTKCGGGEAVKLADRLVRAATTAAP